MSITYRTTFEDFQIINNEEEWVEYIEETDNDYPVPDEDHMPWFYPMVAFTEVYEMHGDLEHEHCETRTPMGTSSSIKRKDGYDQSFLDGLAAGLSFMVSRSEARDEEAEDCGGW